MSDDTHDDMINLDDPSEYEDPVSQRALAFGDVPLDVEKREAGVAH